jgi:branched-subunit amino acid transport protein AzlD
MVTHEVVIKSILYSNQYSRTLRVLNFVIFLSSARNQVVTGFNKKVRIYLLSTVLVYCTPRVTVQ